MAVIAIRIGRNTAITSSAKRRASSMPPSPLSRWLNKGTKPAEKAPSPNSRRNRFGIRKARAKASAAMPAPMIRANTISRAKPSTRLTMVRPPIVPVALTRFIESAPCGRGSGLARHVPGLAAGRLGLLLSGALHVEAGEVDRIEQSGGKPPSIAASAMILRANGKSRRGASARRKGWSCSARHVAEREQARVEQLDAEGDAFVRPWR